MSARLLYYLYGPGKADEHVDPHLVAGWRVPATLEPVIRPDGMRDFRRLTGLLNAPLDMAGRRGAADCIWHCVLSAAPGDRLLSDAEWDAIATDFMDRMRLARRDDAAGVRWVAVRHGLSEGGIDHVHIAATLARQDGRLPSIHNDFLRARQACLAIEQEFGMCATAPADRTAAVRPTRAETELARRTGLEEPPRITLRRQVQEAAALAASEDHFFGMLRDAGIMIRERRSSRDPGRLSGYAVGLPTNTTAPGGVIWYSGGKLAPDLTLPKLRRRWDRPRNADHGPGPVAQDLSARSVRALLRSAVCSAADHARNEPEFFRRLAEAGVLVRHRHSELRPDQITGYAVSLPGHVDGRGEPVWYSGGRLSPDLALPRLQRAWRDGRRAGVPLLSPVDRRAVWDDVIRVTAWGAEQVRLYSTSDLGAAADAAQATADALRVSSRVVRGAPGRACGRPQTISTGRRGRPTALPSGLASTVMLFGWRGGSSLPLAGSMTIP